jgi:hypothetical protein
MSTAASKRKAARPSKTDLTPQQLVIAVLKARAAGSKQYNKADEYMRQLRAKIDCGPVELGPEHDRDLLRLLGEKKFHKLGSKKQAVINDCFKESDKVFRSHGIARYELDIEPSPIESSNAA